MARVEPPLPDWYRKETSLTRQLFLFFLLINCIKSLKPSLLTKGEFSSSAKLSHFSGAPLRKSASCFLASSGLMSPVSNLSDHTMSRHDSDSLSSAEIVMIPLLDEGMENMINPAHLVNSLVLLLLLRWRCLFEVYLEADDN